MEKLYINKLLLVFSLFCLPSINMKAQDPDKPANDSSFSLIGLPIADPSVFFQMDPNQAITRFVTADGIVVDTAKQVNSGIRMVMPIGNTISEAQKNNSSEKKITKNK